VTRQLKRAEPLLPDLRYSHCKKCLLEWKQAPDPLGGICTGCRGETSEGRLSGCVQAPQHAIAASLSRWSRRPALLERHAKLAERLRELRSAVQQRTAAAQTGRQQVEVKREELRELRRRHETRVSEWAAACRHLEAKRCRISRDEFLRDPAKHRQTLGAFHIYQELSVVRSAVQAERRSQISKLVDIFPLKWIVREDGGERTVSLAQVQSFLVAGVLQDDALKDVEAALSFLLPLVSLLAVYLDVALPFPCAGASGRPGQVLVEIQAWTDNVGEPCRSGFDQRPRAHTEPTASAPSMNRSQIQSECGGAAAQSAWWTRPCVLHPFTGIWFNFSIYDGICTAEFMTALRLLDQNLRKLCMSQGVVPPLDSSTLQLLAS